MRNKMLYQRKWRWVFIGRHCVLVLLCLAVFALALSGRVIGRTGPPGGGSESADTGTLNAVGINSSEGVTRKDDGDVLAAQLTTLPEEQTTATEVALPPAVPYVRPKGIHEAPNGQGKLVALTFDDGPNPITLDVLESISKVGGYVTFFCLGNLAEKHEDILKKIVAQGSEIASHSHAHKHLIRLTGAEVKQDLAMASNALKNFSGGPAPALMRLPYGESTEEMLKQVNVPVIAWSVDPKDWKYSEQQCKGRSDEQRKQDILRVANSILDGLQDGDIVLMHDLYPFTRDVTDAVIAELHHKGWKFVTVSELFKAKGIALQPGVIYRHAGGQKTEQKTERKDGQKNGPKDGKKDGQKNR